MKRDFEFDVDNYLYAIYTEVTGDHDLSDCYQEGVRKALSALTPRENALLKMRFQEKYPYKKIANAAGISVSRVCQLINRALATLKNAYSKSFKISDMTREMNHLSDENKRIRAKLLEYMSVIIDLSDTISELANCVTSKVKTELNSEIGHYNNEHTLDKYVTELNLSTRALNALTRMEIITIADLMKLSTTDIMKIDNIGEKSFREINAKLSLMGVSIKDDAS